MSQIIHPRTPPEKVDGWVRLSWHVDKIRLRLAGRLHLDCEANLATGLLDRLWLQAACLGHEHMIAIVRPTFADGAVCDWVRQRAKQIAAEKTAHREATPGYPAAADASERDSLQERNARFGSGQRDDFRTIVDYIEANESRH